MRIALPVLRGEVGCACVAREASVERGGMGVLSLAMMSPKMTYGRHEEPRGGAPLGGAHGIHLEELALREGAVSSF